MILTILLLYAKSHANKAKCKQEPGSNVSKDGPT